MDKPWPSFQNVKSPFNNAGAVSGSSQPQISQNTINQIAIEMDKTVQKIESKNIESCQEMLSNMPEVNPDSSNSIPEHTSELDKLLNSGYKPLEKNNGKWSESYLDSNKKLLLE